MEVIDIIKCLNYSFYIYTHVTVFVKKKLFLINNPLFILLNRSINLFYLVLYRFKITIDLV